MIDAMRSRAPAACSPTCASTPPPPTCSKPARAVNRPPRPTRSAWHCCARPRSRSARTIAVTDPRSVVLRRTRCCCRATIAPRNSAPSAAAAPRSTRTPASITPPRGACSIDVLTRQEMPFDVAADLVYSNLRVTVEGDDTQGYRAQLRAQRQDLQLLRGPRGRRVQTTCREPIDRRRWRAWRWSDSRLATPKARAAGWTGRAWSSASANSEDPLVGWTFSRFWTVGGQADLADMRTAQSRCCSPTPCPRRRRAGRCCWRRRPSRAATTRSWRLDLALARTYQRARALGAARRTGRRGSSGPGPCQGMRSTTSNGRASSRSAGVKSSAAAQERLARFPNDVTALRMQVESADVRGAFGDMAAHHAARSSTARVRRPPSTTSSRGCHCCRIP